VKLIGWSTNRSSVCGCAIAATTVVVVAVGKVVVVFGTEDVVVVGRAVVVVVDGTVVLVVVVSGTVVLVVLVVVLVVVVVDVLVVVVGWTGLQPFPQIAWPSVSQFRPLWIPVIGGMMSFSWFKKWSPWPLSLPPSPSTESCATFKLTNGFDSELVAWQICTFSRSGVAETAPVKLNTAKPITKTPTTAIESFFIISPSTKK
jgi:hypothetical protein